MTNEKMKSFTSSKPKEQTLTGFLFLPLRVGERALICQDNRKSIMTSPVKEILEVSLYGVVFRTCNTTYRLNYTPSPNSNEVMCA